MLVSDVTVADQLEFESWPKEQQELAQRVVSPDAVRSAFDELLEEYNDFRDYHGASPVKATQFLH